MTLPKCATFLFFFLSFLFFSFTDGGTIAGGGQRGARETDQVSLLSAQSAHLLATGVRRPASVQRRLRQIELHATAVRLSRKIPGSVQRVLGQRRPAHDRAGDRSANQGW